MTEGEPDKSVPITHAYNHHYIVSKTFLAGHSGEYGNKRHLGT